MAESELLAFERDNFGREIQVWLDSGNGSVASTKMTVPVSLLQRVLRSCNALDEGTIGMFTAMELNAHAVHIQNVGSVIKQLGIVRI